MLKSLFQTLLMASFLLSCTGDELADIGELPFERFPCDGSLYVDAERGDDSNLGKSSGSAYKTLSAAVRAADDYDRICVAKGIYSATTNGEVFPIVIDKQIVVIGDPKTAGGLFASNPTIEEVTAILGGGDNGSGRSVAVQITSHQVYFTGFQVSVPPASALAGGSIGIEVLSSNPELPVWITSNYITGVTGGTVAEGVLLNKKDTYAKIEGNIFEGNKRGLSIGDKVINVFGRDNIFYNNTEAGLYVGGEGHTVDFGTHHKDKRGDNLFFLDDATITANAGAVSVHACISVGNQEVSLQGNQFELPDGLRLYDTQADGGGSVENNQNRPTSGSYTGRDVKSGGAGCAGSASIQMSTIE